MKIYLNETVWDVALDRIRYLFKEFPNVVVGFSGGKDSTVTLQLALIAAEEQGKLPVKVCFVDQEAEYQMTIDYVRQIMADDRVEPLWVQVPIKLLNATSMEESWLKCWEPGAEWMRPKEPQAITENTFGTDRFGQIFEAMFKTWFPNEPACYLAGLRTEESPSRMGAVASGQTYKHITYGKVLNKKRDHYTFYPIYDWCLSDIWKAIHDNGWAYCRIYDELYRHGANPHKMRVSNLHHETAVHSLFDLHEIEPETWNALTKRLKGVNQAKHISSHEMIAVQRLPYMFRSWEEYRDYLTEKLITVDEYRIKYQKAWARMDKQFAEMAHKEDLIKKQIASLLVNDIDLHKLENFINSAPMIVFRHWKGGRLDGRKRAPSAFKYVPEEHRPR